MRDASPARIMILNDGIRRQRGDAVRIKESLRLHSRHQIEIKQEIRPDASRKASRYRVETFFFIPAALLINAQTFSTRNFVQRLKNYVRVRLPVRGLSDFMTGGAAFIRLERALTYQDDAVGEIKRSVLDFKRSIEHEVKAILKAGDERAVEPFLIQKAQAQGALRARLAAAPPPARQAAEAADEFASVTASRYVKLLLPFDARLRAAPVRAALAAEAAYRAECFRGPQALGPEALLYRWRALKKFISSQLFLKVQAREGNPVLLQSLYGLAAAVSMIFATWVAFSSQAKYGTLSWNLFLATVIAYIFKDRLKDYMKSELAQVFRPWLPDRRLVITRETGQKVGDCREFFGFVAPEKLPAVVKTLREASHYVDFGEPNAESVFASAKHVELDHEGLGRGEDAPLYFYDVTRFNLAPWLENIDLQFEELPFADLDDETLNREIVKLYHIYVVRLVSVNDATAPEAVEVVRLVVAADGVHRLERVPVDAAAQARVRALARGRADR